MPSSFYYENITLVSLDGDLSVVVYLPYDGRRHPHHPHYNNNEEEEDTNPKNYYYDGSRFDHGSMIGSITTKRRRRQRRTKSNRKEEEGDPEEEEEEEETHELFGSDLWRLPHNRHWPESGIGLASEFGVGDDGSMCDVQCGYSAASYGITNGVLGYEEEDTFLKIGVGVLYKGTCPACDSTQDYKFNSPYQMASTPIWTIQPNVVQLVENIPVSTVIMDHEAMTSNHKYGYKIHKEIYIHPNNASLIVTTRLYNIGQSSQDDPTNNNNNNNNHHGDDASFSTVWYSHNFFTCDHQPVGPGYMVDLDIQGDTILQQQSQQVPPPGMGVPSSSSFLYDEPGTWSWSKPIAEYSTIQSFPQSIHVQMHRHIEPGVQIKTEFKNDHDHTRGGFTIQACDTILESTLSWPEQFNVPPNDPSHDNNPQSSPNDEEEVNHNHRPPTIEMYAYNLYMERGTFSPEPQLLLSHLQPGGPYVEWTQTITIRPVIHDDDDDDEPEYDWNDMATNSIVEQPSPPFPFLPTEWLTNLLPGYKPPTTTTTTPSKNLPDLGTTTIMMILSTMSLLVLLLVLVTFSSMRRRQQQQYRHRQQYEAIA